MSETTDDRQNRQLGELWEIVRENQQGVRELRALLIGVDGRNGIRGVQKSIQEKLENIAAMVAAHDHKLNGCVDEVGMNAQIYEIKEMIQQQEEKRREARDEAQQRTVQMRIALIGLAITALIGIANLVL